MSNQLSRVVCPFCHIVGESSDWLRLHLTGWVGDKLTCTEVPDGIKEVLQDGRSGDLRKANVKDMRPQTSNTGSQKRLKQEPVENLYTSEHPEGSSSNVKNDSLLKEAKKSIGIYFYENGLDFDIAKLPSFRRMVTLGFGSEVNIPTNEELKGWILDDSMKEIEQYVNDIKGSWVQTGCSILLDGWTNREGRFLMSILVDCPKGALYLRTCDISDLVEDMQAMLSFFRQVIEEVGVDNVVQIITNSTSTLMKEIGAEVMEKHSQIFWTVDTHCCVELMLEKYGLMVSETLDKAKTITRFIHGHSDVLKLLHDYTIGRDLIVHSKTRLAVSFFTLENIVAEEMTLKSMFLSPSFQTSTDEGKRVVDLVRSKAFWSVARTVVRAAIPLVRTLELMNNNKSHMDYIYETMDQVKEAIREGFNKTVRHKPFWKVLDDVWNDHLYSPLHAAGYYMNPNIFYTDDVHIDMEILVGLFSSIYPASDSRRVLQSVFKQLEQYQNGSGAFAVGREADNRVNIPSVDWWSRYGGECPELQRVAIRILSQTCLGASKFQLNRNLAEKFLKQGRNQTEHQRKLAFVHYNMYLKNFASGNADYIPSNEGDPTDDWY